MKKTIIFVALALMSTVAFADNGSSESLFNGFTRSAFYFLAVGLAAFGGTAAQSRAASAALEGIARNPGASDKLVTPMIIGMALMESLVIFTFITIFVGK